MLLDYNKTSISCFPSIVKITNQPHNMHWFNWFKNNSYICAEIYSRHFAKCKPRELSSHRGYEPCRVPPLNNSMCRPSTIQCCWTNPFPTNTKGGTEPIWARLLLPALCVSVYVKERARERKRVCVSRGLQEMLCLWLESKGRHKAI